jgi:hypothetical protein
MGGDGITSRPALADGQTYASATSHEHIAQPPFSLMNRAYRTLSRLLTKCFQLAVTEPSGCSMIVARLKSGGGDGGIDGAHDADTTFQRSCPVTGDADVGAVGDCEQPIANSNMSPHAVRVTIASRSRGNAIRGMTIQMLCQRDRSEFREIPRASRRTVDLRIRYSRPCRGSIGDRLPCSARVARAQSARRRSA